MTCPLKPVPFGMPFGLAVTTMVDGAVPVTTSSVNQGTSLLADQSIEPEPALPIGQHGRLGTRRRSS